ncbi:MAG: twin-arginine translocase TatA/TatE family subunit [Proteobacteria bacterium]|nr:twin-arginine translocase TatA/TatE family subunit [Pseudomonadota bacterium]
MFGLGQWELLIILVIVLMVFGAGKLPGVMKELGNGVRSFKDSMNGKDDAAEGEEDEAPKAVKKAAPKKAAAKPVKKAPAKKPATKTAAKKSPAKGKKKA